MKISVKSVHFHVDSKLVAYIEQKLNRLTKLFDRITEAEVHLKLQDTGARTREKITEIHLHLPGGWIVDKKTGKTFETALGASIDTLKRQVSRHKEKIQSYPREKPLPVGEPALAEA